jgi:hypothetical protein
LPPPLSFLLFRQAAIVNEVNVGVGLGWLPSARFSIQN